MYQYYQEIDQDIIKKILLKERVKELAERIETCKFNLGKYWVKNVPAYQLVFLTNGKGDDYDKLQISIENRNLLFSKERMVYVERERNLVVWNGREIHRITSAFF